VRASGSRVVFLEQVASPREGLDQVVHLHSFENPKMCLPGVCGNGRKSSEFEILKISNLVVHYFG
jgi:hypothetical protein